MTKPKFDSGAHEVDLSEIPLVRSSLQTIYDDARAHFEAGKRTALAYYRANANMVTKLRKMGLQASSRSIPIEAAKKAGVPYGKRGGAEIFVRYDPNHSGGNVPVPGAVAGTPMEPTMEPKAPKTKSKPKK